MPYHPPRRKPNHKHGRPVALVFVPKINKRPPSSTTRSHAHRIISWNNIAFAGVHGSFDCSGRFWQFSWPDLNFSWTLDDQHHRKWFFVLSMQQMPLCRFTKDLRNPFNSVHHSRPKCTYRGQEAYNQYDKWVRPSEGFGSLCMTESAVLALHGFSHTVPNSWLVYGLVKEGSHEESAARGN